MVFCTKFYVLDSNGAFGKRETANVKHERVAHFQGSRFFRHLLTRQLVNLLTLSTYLRSKQRRRLITFIHLT